jgi:hypothetical protein
MKILKTDVTPTIASTGRGRLRYDQPVSSQANVARVLYTLYDRLLMSLDGL